MKTLTRSLVAVFVVLSVTALIGTAAAAPTYTRTLETTTVSAGDTVHVRLDLDLDVAGTLAGMCERYDRTTSNVNWTITNIESSPEFTTLVLKNNTGEYDIGVGFTTLPAGTYYAEYDLVINPETPAGTYDLTGFYQDSNNIDPTIDAIGDTQLTVTMPVDVLYDDVANLDAGASDQDALNATGLNYSFLPAGPHVFLNMEGYDVSSATSSYWSMWINGVDYGFNFANFGTSNLSDGDVVEFLYTNGTLNATTARATIEVNITESSSSSPTYTRTLESTTVSAGDTVHVRLDLDLDVAGTLAGMCERYDRTTSNVNWTITNIESSPEFTTLVLKNNTGEYDIGVGFTTLPAGTYYAEYDLMINPETPAGTYDLTGFYQDSNNIDPTIDAIGDTQLTVTMPVDVLYDDVANLDAGASDQDALNATGLNYSFLPAGPHVFLNMEGYDVSSATSSYWSMWINGVDYGFNFANFGTNNLSDGDVVEFLYTNGTLNAATARVTIEANMDAIDTPTLSFDSASSSVIEGQETEIGIIADILPDGLSGYNLTVTLDDPSVAEIVGISYPSWVNITENSSLPGSSVYLTALDGNDVIQAGAEDVVLATLTVSGKDVGLANLSIEVTRMDDDAGYQIEPTLTTGEVEVTLFTLPDQENSARDLDGDGLYEDLTGNGEFSFVDIVVYFHNIEWIDENLPTEYFDFNDNGRIDFDDIVDMFQILE